MGMNDKVLRGVYDYGFKKPSDIQQRAVLSILKGRDVIAQARELASQTEKEIQSIGVHTKIEAHACIGGKSIGEDMKKLERGGVHAVSGTPGRVVDMIKRGSLQTKSVKLLILMNQMIC
ncbi:hypothetical protein Bca52824_011239 [Brassica carinata]|uniref:DEAD-box RNA helicase Q domain-containing protein n=1 Tax=Brassica carinata TaxID=52824 RepID=A0A8X7WFE6_BRACI|nr:hypothetical protein Bca52824_011239 [Brassica carinata]